MVAGQVSAVVIPILHRGPDDQIMIFAAPVLSACASARQQPQGGQTAPGSFSAP